MAKAKNWTHLPQVQFVSVSWSPPQKGLLRMEDNSRRQNSVLDQHKGRFSIRVCRFMGWLEKSGEWRMAVHLYDHHWRTKRMCKGRFTLGCQSSYRMSI